MQNEFQVILSASLDTTSTETNIKSYLAKIEKEISININTKVNTSQYKSAGDSMRNLATETRNAKSELQGIGDAFGKFALWRLIGDVQTIVINAVRDTINTVVELDSSLVELSKVSDLSGNALADFGEKAYDVGEKVGRTRYRNN